MKTSEWLKKYSIVLKKRFGQNFLSDEVFVNKIVSFLNISENDVIIEIGPGAGTLTEALLKTKANVFAYEIDTTLEKLLKKRFENFKNFNLTIDDFLDVNLKDFKTPIYVANIPYNISSPIFEKIFTETPDFKYAILMVQKEFGERVTAKSGKSYSPLSVFSQFYCDVETLINVPKSAFIPNPKIDSVVVKLTPNIKDKEVNPKLFLDFIHKCFSQRRKTIRNNLKLLTENAENILKDLNIDSSIRPENLSIETFIKIYKKIDSI